MPAKPFISKYAFLGGLTAASLALAPGPSATEQPTCYVDEFDACYRWTPGSVVAADGYRVIGHTGGAAGRWVLEGNMLTLSPQGAGDWARYAGAAAAVAGYATLKLAAGTWAVDSNQVTPSNSNVNYEIR